MTKPEAAGVRPPDWEFETTARQLANLARVQSDAADFTETEAWAAFTKFLDESPMGKGGDVSAEAVRRLFDGKVGLALSGGGFRASLFHIGVLARLAELDMLRRVEVISCVSGGSIVGAHYYLELRSSSARSPTMRNRLPAQRLLPASRSWALYFLWLRGVPDLGGVLAHKTVGALLLVIGSPAARYHMKNFEKRYLDLGRFVKPTA